MGLHINLTPRHARPLHTFQAFIPQSTANHWQQPTTMAWGTEVVFCSPGHCHVWRWRELNSRPTKHAQVFSGCSPLCRCFWLQCSHELVTDELSHVSVPSRPVTNLLSSGFLKRRQAPRRKHPQTDGFRSSLRRRGRNRCAFQWHLLVYRESFTR